MKEHVMPAAMCPACGYAVDRATGVHGSPAAPKPADLTICLDCGELLTFGADLRLERLPRDVLIEVIMHEPETARTLQRAREEIRKRGRLPPKPEARA